MTNNIISMDLVQLNTGPSSFPIILHSQHFFSHNCHLNSFQTNSFRIQNYPFFLGSQHLLKKKKKLKSVRFSQKKKKKLLYIIFIFIFVIFIFNFVWLCGLKPQVPQNMSSWALHSPATPKAALESQLTTHFTSQR